MLRSTVVFKQNNRAPPIKKKLTHIPGSILQVPTTQLAKINVDQKFVELTADVLDFFLYIVYRILCSLYIIPLKHTNEYSSFMLIIPFLTIDREITNSERFSALYFGSVMSLFDATDEEALLLLIVAPADGDACCCWHIVMVVVVVVGLLLF